MRILIAHNRYRRFGGEDRHIALLGGGLRDAGAETRLFELDSAVLERSRLKRWRAGAMLAYDPAAGGIAPVVEEWRPDVVHFHNTWPLLTPAALRVARRRGAAVVQTMHNCRFACPGGTCSVDAHPARGELFDNRCLAGSSLRCALTKDPRGNRFESIAYGAALELQRRMRMLDRWVDAFVAPSEYVAQMLKLIGVRDDHIHMIRHGVPSAAARADGDGDARYALFIGRLSEEKGIRTLIRAAAIAREIPLAVAGAGPLAGQLRAAGVDLLGQLDRHELNEALAGAAFTIIPSESHENFPYAALESFAAAKPVIATRVGGLPEIVHDQETGLVIAPRSPEELATAMRHLWHDAALTRRLGAGAQRLVEEEFSFEAQIGRTIELYRASTRARAEAPR